MKLQLALDCNLNFDRVIELIDMTKNHIDIVELGTPLLLEQGSQIVKRVCALFPKLLVLADTKIIDAGKYEVNTMCEEGAKLVTALAVADDVTIKFALEEAHRHGASLLVDMIAVKNLIERTKELVSLGVDYICLHTANDLVVNSFDIKQLDKEYITIRELVPKGKLVISGGINLNNIDSYRKYRPDIIIVGGGICNDNDPMEKARLIKEKMETWND